MKRSPDFSRQALFVSLAIFLAPLASEATAGMRIAGRIKSFDSTSITFDSVEGSIRVNAKDFRGFYPGLFTNGRLTGSVREYFIPFKSILSFVPSKRTLKR